ncbi:MAG: DUF5667 domain-containing protein [Anaerolineales bacterium]|nr:DUF5667 domain-containing protein [Anaerolineales bacterium]
MNNLYDLLEICLQELENGADVKTVLARYPESADELRPLLMASIAARKRTSAQIPSPEAIRRGRAKLLQRAAEIREARIAPRKRMIPLFQRLAISFTLTATFLLSGTGLVGASSSALPGQKLYPVKRGWEDVRLLLTFNEDKRNSLEQEIESERLQEVDELLAEAEHLQVDFFGVFTSKDGAIYVSNVQTIFPVGTQLPIEGDMLHVAGWTTDKGYVEVSSFEVLQGALISSTPKPISTPTPVNDEETPPTQPIYNSGENDGQPTEEDTNVEITPVPTDVHKDDGKDKNEKDDINKNESESESESHNKDEVEKHNQSNDKKSRESLPRFLFCGKTI